MNPVDKRNKRIRNILESYYQKAIDSNCKVDESAYTTNLDKLFTTESWGFREILLVVIMGMLLDRNYKSSTGLYDCNPRAIYEGPIKEFLIEKHIPHRKSGPLNVAKATVGLDMTWARQRRPSDVAFEVVNLVNFLEANASKREKRIDKVAISLLRRFIDCAERIKELKVDVNPTSDPEFIYHLCDELITLTPDGGNTPQKIAGYLLKNYHKDLMSGFIVTGGGDRASVTSTTSKKPGDINEETPEGVVRRVYEITVKRFDLPRIRDSYDSVCIYNKDNESANIHEIIIICRKIDCPSNINKSNLHGYLGSYTHQNITYYYWDIYEWIANTLQQMTTDGRREFYLDLKSYIDDINTSETVKKEWKRLHEK